MARYCTNARNGARPVPSPAMISGAVSLAGSFITDGLTDTVSAVPGASCDRKRVACP